MKPRVSPSQLDTFAGKEGCQRKWAASRLFGSTSNKYAAQGTRVHGILESWLQGGTLIDTRTEDGMIASSGIEHLPKPGLCTVETDFRFETENAIYTGRRDMRFRDPVTGLEVIGDHKTTTDLGWAKTPKDLLVDAQGLVYAESVFRDANVREVELRWVYYTTRKPYKSKRVSLNVIDDKEHRARFDKLEESAIEIGRWTGDKAGEWRFENMNKLPPNPHACEAFGGCGYRDRCDIDKKERFGSIMAHSALQERVRSGLAARGAGTPAPAATPTPAAAPADAGPAQSPAQKLAALRAKKAAEEAAKNGTAPAATATQEREQVLEQKAAERAVEIAKEVDTQIDNVKPRGAVQGRAPTPALAREGLPVDQITDKHSIGGLRDQLAMSALNGMLARGFDRVTDAGHIASRAYEYADAMLSARAG